MKVGDRVYNRSYGIGTLKAIESPRGESIAWVRWDAFIGTLNDSEYVTPLLGLSAVAHEDPYGDG